MRWASRSAILQDQRDQAIATPSRNISGVPDLHPTTTARRSSITKPRAVPWSTASPHHPALLYTPGRQQPSPRARPSAPSPSAPTRTDITGEITFGQGAGAGADGARPRSLPRAQPRAQRPGARPLRDDLGAAGDAAGASRFQAAGNLSSQATVGQNFTPSATTNDYGFNDSNGNRFNGQLRFTFAAGNVWQIDMVGLTRQADNGRARRDAARHPHCRRRGTALSRHLQFRATQQFTPAAGGGPTGSLTLPVVTLQVGSEPATFLGQDRPAAVCPPAFFFSFLTSSS